LNRVNRETLCSPDTYPIYFERITKRLKIPVWIVAVSVGAAMGVAFAVSNIAAGLSALEHFPVIFAELVSIVLATILVIEVRDRTLAAYSNLLPALDKNQQDRFSTLLKSIFDQRRSLIFSALVGAGGIVHHVILSYLIWGSIWWYSAVDIILIGFVWWFVVASFFWTCVSVAAYSFYASKSLQLVPRLLSYRRMCGLESFGTLSVVPSVAWALVATFGTFSTFEPAPAKSFPQLLIIYLGFDFLIVASSMTVLFFLPILGYRLIVLPAKREWSTRIDELMSQAGVIEVPHSIDVEDPVALRTLHLLVLSTQVRQIKDWPLSLGTSIRFLLSYGIPAAGFIARLIFYAVGVQIPL
jgi:hypothetical protein